MNINDILVNLLSINDILTLENKALTEYRDSANGKIATLTDKIAEQTRTYEYTAGLAKTALDDLKAANIRTRELAGQLDELTGKYNQFVSTDHAEAIDDLAQLRHRYADLQGLCDDLASQNGSLRGTLASMATDREHTGEMRKQINALHQQLDDLRRNEHEYAQSVTRYTTEIAAANHTIAALRAENETLSNSNALSNDTITRYMEQNSALTKENGALEQERAAFKERIASIGEETNRIRQELSDRVALLEKENAARVTSFNDETARLRREFELRENENNRLREDFTSQIKNLQETNEVLVTEKAIMASALEHAQADHTQTLSATQMKAAFDNVANMRTIVDLQARILELESSLAELESRLAVKNIAAVDYNSLIDEKSRLEKELDTARDNVSSCKKENDALLAENNTLKSSLEDAQRRMEGIITDKVKHDSLSRQVESMKSHISKLEETMKLERDNHAAEISRIQSELNTAKVIHPFYVYCTIYELNILFPSLSLHSKP